MEISAVVHIRLDGLKRFAKQVNEQLNGQAGPIHSCLRLWAVRYRSFAQIRFDLFSRSGGNWKPLAASTIAKRRHGTKSNVAKLRAVYAQKKSTDPASVSLGGVYSILRDTGLLFNALNPIFLGAPGALEEDIKYGIRVGYGGPQRHSIGGIATIADIASFHQNGNEPKLPQREIIVSPPPELIAIMAEDMRKALIKVAKS